MKFALVYNFQKHVERDVLGISFEILGTPRKKISSDMLEQTLTLPLLSNFKILAESFKNIYGEITF